MRKLCFRKPHELTPGRLFTFAVALFGAVVAGAFILAASAGCVVRLSDNGEVGIRQGTELVFFSRTSTTNAKSEASLEQGLVRGIGVDESNDSTASASTR